MNHLLFLYIQCFSVTKLADPCNFVLPSKDYLQFNVFPVNFEYDENIYYIVFVFNHRKNVQRWKGLILDCNQELQVLWFNQ